MAVKIRLRRMGQKNAPFYRIVLEDSKSPRDGRFIEEISIESSLQIPDPREMVNSSRRLEHTIRTRIPAFTK